MMVVTKELEQEIRVFMDDYWNTYLSGDLATWSGFLADDYKNIGGTEEEIWNSKHEILDYSEAIMQQMVGLVELRNKRIEVFSLDPYVLAHEFTDMYIKTENEWTFYGKFRLSTILKKDNNRWLVVHQHGSYPDGKTEQGEAFAFDKISTENRELKEAIKRRTVELENKNKELEIEAALERVRTVAMGMNKPVDMLEVCKTISKQLELLKVKDIRNVQTIIIYENKKTYVNYEYYTRHDKELITEVDYLLHPAQSELVEQMQKGPEEYFSKSFEGEEVQKWFAYQKTTNQFLDSFLETARSINWYFYSMGPVALGLSTYEPLEEEAILLFKRFRNVFGLSYRRYLDIEKAEGQAREAQIQLALERVRARTMAMQKSSELAEVSALLFQQLKLLDINTYSSGFTIWDNEKGNLISWMCNADGSMNPPFVMPISGDEWHIQQYESWKNREEFLVKDMTGEEMQSHFRYLRSFPLLDAAFNKSIAAGHSMPERQVHNVVNFSYGNLLLITLQPCPDAHDIFKRFAKVFEQTYRRFLDLERSEAQAREAQIQLALEKVSARAMSMQRPEELNALVGTVFSELTRLDLVLTRCVIMIHNPVTKDSNWLMANSEEPGKPINLFVQYHEHPPNLAYLKGWKERIPKWQYILEGQTKKDWDNYIFSETGLSNLPDFVIANMRAPERVYLNASFASFGNITLATLEPLSDEHFNILTRFANVFDITYTRYNDLKKAEAQAKEATIEAALEKVRGKAIAMQNSNDLSVTASMVFTELRKLGINPIRCGVGLLTKESRKAQLYSATSAAGGDSLSLVGWVILTGHPVLEHIYESWLKNEEYYPCLVGDQLQSYYEQLLAGLSVSVPDWKSGQKQYGHFLSFSVGCLYAWSEVPYEEEEIKILKRFASVIELTFKRYIELQKAEANAAEALKQAALDRVRADIASMRSTADLERITPLIWNELTIIGVPFIRCGVFLMDEQQQQVQTHLATPDGKAIAAFKLSYTAPGEIREIIAHWQRKQVYKQHWDENQFIAFAMNLISEGAITSDEKYVIENRPTDLYLHFIPFSQGMLYAGNTEPLSDEALKLMQEVAEAFSTAYARYEDFNRLELAKKQVDAALVELKATQAQLIQSEKMASLGELTAGIAHEIQNPLNFVNNFSEVNEELIAELQEEVRAGNTVDALSLATAVNDNLKKIIHHGKRADSIVKGMLQHSRTDTGKKEFTDINALADEYLRLSYHGLRAKEKSFTAIFETHFDPSLKPLEVIPQEIGRVLLNLFNNAFYAVNEKKKTADNNYEPTVSVSTEATGKLAIIKVKDNGNGIPATVIDKIFQPFFTTKPTGEGTGLGLSMSYDIITKGHGGEMKVETKEGVGTQFIIQLPLN